jgi:spermidine synthase
MLLYVFSFSVFLNAFLLFLIQPMIARMALPLLGGSPSVWNTAMVFYQAVLLAGYAYAHFFLKWLGACRLALLHFLLLLGAAAALPVHIPKGWQPTADANPEFWLLALLSVSIGLPFFALSAGSPLFQSWFAVMGHRDSRDPYFLYAAGNLGSLSALIAYPALVEPYLRLAQQGMAWTLGYGLLVLATGFCIFLLFRKSRTEAVETAAPLPDIDLPMFRTKLRWLLLALVPSSLMLSVTSYLTSDIASVPLLWVIPLGLYLLSFILVFRRHPLLSHAWMVKSVRILILPLIIILMARSTRPIALLILLHLATLFAISMALHGELARSRPPVSSLTQFYMIISTGGMLGGIFSALLAPALFNSIAEYPIMLTMACLLVPWPWGRGWQTRDRLLDLTLPVGVGILCILLALLIRQMHLAPVPAGALVFGLPALLTFSFSRRPLRFALGIGIILLVNHYVSGSEGYLSGIHMKRAARSFFGVLRIFDDSQGKYRLIMHGSTLHGGQSLEPGRRLEPLFYYHRTGPLAQAFQTINESIPVVHVAVIGLGAGGTAAYAQPGQHWTYFEIDPLVAQIARDPHYFTYLKDCPAEPNIVLGDGRISLMSVTDAFYDVLILDAYSSDSVPVHLLTREALQLYLQKLAPRGALIFHISNRYLDLEPVLGNLARQADLLSLVRCDRTDYNSDAGKVPSTYLVMSRSKETLRGILSDTNWRKPRVRTDLGLWTDDYSSVLSIIRWRGHE